MHIPGRPSSARRARVSLRYLTAGFQALIGRSFFLVRTLAGSDKVKAQIMKEGAAEIIVSSLETLKVSLETLNLYWRYNGSSWYTEMLCLDSGFMTLLVLQNV